MKTHLKLLTVALFALLLFTSCEGKEKPADNAEAKRYYNANNMMKVFYEGKISGEKDAQAFSHTLSQKMAGMNVNTRGDKVLLNIESALAIMTVLHYHGVGSYEDEELNFIKVHSMLRQCV